MIAMIESAMSVRFPSGSNFCSSSYVPCYRSLWSSEESAGGHGSSGRRRSFDVTRGYQNGSYAVRRLSSNVRKKVRAIAEHLGSVPDPIKCNGRSGYHPFEDIAELASERGGEACLTLAETTRTVVEVNDKATLLFSGLLNEDFHESIVWPDLPYMNDEHGNIYFQVNTEEDIFQNIASEDNIVQIIIGLDTTELISDMELSGPATVGFGIEEIDDEDEDDSNEDDDDDMDGGKNDDYYQDWVSALEEEDSDQSDENPGDWATLETMRSAHPMYFAKKLAQVSAWGLDEGDSSRNGTSFYTLDLAKIQLLSVQVHPDMPMVEVEDFLKAKPDAIAHSAADIVSHLKAGGEKTIQALKALCWRCKGMQVEEAQIINVDSLGFDVRVCSGTQLQTLRFTFDARATSVSSAERKLNNLLFPKGQAKPQKTKQIHISDS